jgi:hypothetical protein
MTPSEEALKQWLESMRAMQTLTNIGMEHMDMLLQGIAMTIFQNPLLRMIMIDEKPHIAHVTPYIGKTILLRFLDNPLENTSSKGDYRAKAATGSNTLIIEQNMGLRHKSDVERAIDKRCHEAGNDMMRTGDYTGRAGQEFSTLRNAMLSSYGSAFEWKAIEAHKLSEFKTLQIVQRKNDAWYDTPTFDLILSSK